ncbi:MAG: hypothetical protein HXX10_19800 [Rhodoplanes sp.]|uniref:hypothetical protein n=1 Tax=Rhodoplanes sp. TaxID=1968906 RepID=UPI00183FDC6F|nr:hypothetical protein [Rhodoplanes sp.]NVO16281.1 hypothetical protein [Rhodoplanes sp.]
MSYYVRQARILAHHALYDRACDAVERWPTGQSLTVASDDVVGAPGHHRDRRYEAIPRLPLLWSIAALRIDPARYTFVDYGAGRGRALLTAARLPFARCIGVEFSATLQAEACDNIAAYPRDRLACRDLQVVHMNAADFVPPAGDLMLFFYNPFTATVLDAVADRIEAASQTGPRAIRIVYVNAARMALFWGRPAFRRLPIPLAARARLALLGAGPMEFFAVGTD